LWFRIKVRAIPWAVFLFVVLCFALHPLSPLTTQHLADPDDYMRLNEVISWLQGQSWFDLSVPRMSVGNHTVIHWSRLVDLPLALVILPLLFFFSMPQAAMLASFIVPLVLLGVLLWLVRKQAEDFLSSPHAPLACLFVLFAPMVLFQFTPGRVDHHAYQILIAAFGCFALPRIVHDEKGWRYALAASFAFAWGLWIGTEAVPWLGIFLVCLSLFSAWHGGLALRNAALFGGTFCIATLLVLLAALPPHEYQSLALSWFSGADVILAFESACVFGIAWALGKHTENRFLRLTLATTLGVFALLLFIIVVPESLNGPFTNYDHFNSTIALDNISEARALAPALIIDHHNPLTYLRFINVFSSRLFLPLLALGCVFYNLRKVRGRSLTLWLVQGVFLITSLLLTLFVQLRIGNFLQYFYIMPLAWFFVQALRACDARLPFRLRLPAKIAVFLMLCFVPIVLIPSLFENKIHARDVFLFPAARPVNNCKLKLVTDHLNTHYVNHRLTIMAGMNEGPELLFRTPHSVIGGNYNVAGNTDIYDFFRSKDEQAAQDILRKRRVDLVLTCRSTPPFFSGLDRIHFGRNAFLQQQSDGKLHIISSFNRPTMIEKLVNGTPPAWLKPVEIPDNSDYLLYEFKE